MHPGILLEHGFKQNSNQYTTLPWFGTKMAQKYAKRDQSTQTGFCCDVKCHILMFSTSEQCQVATFCTCAVVFRKKCHVSGYRCQAGDVFCLRSLMSLLCAQQFGILNQQGKEEQNVDISLWL